MKIKQAFIIFIFDHNMGISEDSSDVSIKIGTNPVTLFAVADFNVSGEYELKDHFVAAFTAHHYDDVPDTLAYQRFSGGVRMYFTQGKFSTKVSKGVYSNSSMLGRFITLKAGLNRTAVESYTSIEIYAGESINFGGRMFMEYKIGLVRFLKEGKSNDMLTPSAGFNIGVMF